MDESLNEQLKAFGFDMSLAPKRYAMFGGFVSMFALVESSIKDVLRQVVGVDKKTAVAIFSGTRGEQACSYIRRCYEARGEAIPPTLDAILSRFASINTFRNDLLHYMPNMMTIDDPIVTNERGVIRNDAVRRVPFEAGHVDLLRDLILMEMVLRDFPGTKTISGFGHLAGHLPAWLATALEPKSHGRKKPAPNTRPARKSRPSKKKG